jgi:hypothetical protein
MGSLGVRRVITQLAAWMRFLLVATLATAGVGGCGGGDSDTPAPAPPPQPQVVSVAVIGVPSTPLAPMQYVQLNALATLADGAVQDVTETATWTASDAGVLALSGTGLITAKGVGKADVAAAVNGVAGRANVQVVEFVQPSAAYFKNDVQYAFDYVLDAQGRVDSYQITRLPGQTTYYGDPAIRSCEGSFAADYRCLGEFLINPSVSRLSGSSSGFVLISPVPTVSGTFYTKTFTFGAQGLSTIKVTSSQLKSFLTETTTLEYDPVGRLKTVDVKEVSCQIFWPCSERTSTAVVTTDELGRMQRSDAGATLTLWTYGWQGLMEQTLTTQSDASGLLGTALTRYTHDGRGWITSRFNRMESTGSPTTEATDTYTVIRFDKYVIEEQFTRAEPRDFYTSGQRQRVRYEWGRLPTEPLFVPRALSGTKGVDYFGIVNSHLR